MYDAVSMKACSCALIACFSVAFCAPGWSEAEGFHVKRVSLMDPGGFQQPMESASSVLPVDWSHEGGIIWRIHGECSRGHMMQWQAKSEDGQASITIYPTIGWRLSSIPAPQAQDCIAGNFGSAEEFVSAMLQDVPGGRVIDVQRDEKLQQQLPHMFQELPGDPYMKSWADAASITTEYEVDGITYQSIVLAFTGHHYMKSGFSTGFGPGMEMATGGAFNTAEFAAPKARFQEFLPTFTLFQNNYRINAEWQALISKHTQAMARDNQETAANIARINAETHREISAMRMDSWQRQRASDDRHSREFSELILEQETYAADTPSGQVALPMGYERAFQLQDDSFFLTNDLFLEPGRDLGQAGRELSVLP